VGKLRALLIVAGIVLSVFVVGAILVAVLSREGTRTQRVDGEITRVEVLSERGALTVRAGAPGGADLVSRERWILIGPDVDATVRDGTLRVDVTCPRMSLVSCSADLDLGVPQGVALEVKTIRGNLEVDGLDGAMTVLSEDGDVTVRGAPPSVDARSVTGRVTAELSSPPDTVTLRSETQDVRLVMPSGAYDIQADSTLGSERVEGVRDVPDSPRTIIASSGAGNVSVTATP